MIPPLLLAAFLLQSSGDVPARFQALHEKQDRDGCAALWRERPALALATLEADLDRAAALHESEKGAGGAAIRALEQRALWGAAIARDALGAPLIADLVAARVGWSEKERGYARDQRAIQDRARSQLEKADNKFGQESAHEAVSRALALGDWHAAATAYETCAIAYQALSNFDDALLAWSQARRLYRELRLADREIACLRGALDMCFATDRAERGREIADQAAAAARALGDRKGTAEFLGRRAGFEAKLGLASQAEATRKEAQALEK